MWNEVNSVTVALLVCGVIKTEFSRGKMAEGQRVLALVIKAISKAIDTPSPFLFCEICI